MGRIASMLCYKRPVFLVLFGFTSAVWGQYKADSAGAPPPELKPVLAQMLEKSGFLISNASGKYCEVWFRVELPGRAAPSNEPNVTLPAIAVGTLLGVIRFDVQGADRRGQTIQPGLYMLRYGRLPANSSHEGAAATRDFLLLTPADDQDPNSTPNFDALVALSRKASGSPHPAVLSFRKAETDSPGFSQQGDIDWVLQTSIGDTPIAVIVAGVAGS